MANKKNKKNTPKKTTKKIKEKETVVEEVNETTDEVIEEPTTEEQVKDDIFNENSDTLESTDEPLENVDELESAAEPTEDVDDLDSNNETIENDKKIEFEDVVEPDNNDISKNNDEPIVVTTYDDEVKYHTSESRSEVLDIIETLEDIPEEEEPVVEEPVVKKEKVPLTKEQKDKIKKYIIIGAVSVLLIVVGVVVYFKTIGSNEYKLKKIGYSSQEISTILEKTNQKNRKYLFKNKYLKITSELVSAKGFKKANFDIYLDYYKKYKNVTVKDLIIIGNKNAQNYKYDEFLMNILTSEDYIQDNLKDYMTYHYNNTKASYEDVVFLINRNIKKTHTDMLVLIAKEEYFIYDRLDRYVGYYYSHNEYTSKQIVTNVNADLDRSFYSKIVTTDVNKRELMLVNKYYKLPDKFSYSGELVDVSTDYSNKNGLKLNKNTYEAFINLVEAAEKENLHIRLNFGYRDYNSQEFLYNGYVSSNGIAWADNWYARPGHSENQTGLAIDVGKLGEYNLDQFENTEEYQWMLKNAHKYGFILRYPKGKEYLTGYNNQPWHYRYVGVDTATDIYERNITFEEYYAYFIDK